MGIGWTLGQTARRHWAGLLAGLSLGIVWPASLQADEPAGVAAPETVWRYGMLASYPPYQLWPEGGWPGGADLDLLREAAARAGGQIEPVRYDQFDQLLDDLRAGRIDVASAMGRTPERERELVFGPTYAEIDQVLVLRQRDGDVPLGADLGGRRIAVVSGYASETQVARLFPLADRVPSPDIATALRSLLEGRADVFIEAAPAVREVLDRLDFRDLRIARRVVLGSGELHLAAGVARAHQLAPLAQALDTIPAPDRRAAVARWSAVATAVDLEPPRVDPAARAWLDALPPLSVAVVDRQAPFSMAGDEGQPQGFSVDVLAAALRELGLFERTAWTLMGADAALAALSEGRADLALGLPEAASRHRGIGFAGPFIEHPLSLTARRETGIWSLEQMAGMRLALPRQQVPQTLLMARYPQIEVQTCPDLPACLTMVDRGRADAVAADVVSTALALGTGRWPRLHMVGNAGELRHERGVAISPGLRPLAPLLQQALTGLESTEMPAIKQRWFKRPPPGVLAAALLRRYGPWALAGLIGLLALWAWHARRLRAEVGRTVAARQQAEGAAAAARRFTAFLAHEVRNSLHSVIAGTHLLRTERLPAPAVSASLEQSARATLSLLNDLLDRERLSAGGLTLDLGPTRLNDLVAPVVQEMSPAAGLAGVQLQWLPPRDADPTLMLDTLRVQQVLRNLLANAIRHAGPGRVDVRAQWQPAAATEPTGRLVLTVRDHGPGLSPEQRATLFERFQPGGTAGHGGSGLGLSLSRELARVMGGELVLESPADGGVLARLTLPAAPAVPARPEAAADAKHPPDGPAGSRRVLVVEDAEVYALLLQRALADAGWQVRRAGSVAEACGHLSDEPVDLLLTDLELPDGDARRLLASSGGRARHRVVMSADLDDDVRAIPGADAVVAKSADVTWLVRRVTAGMPA